jgi:hypothetical protein
MMPLAESDFQPSKVNQDHLDVDGPFSNFIDCGDTILS